MGLTAVLKVIVKIAGYRILHYSYCLVLIRDDDDAKNDGLKWKLEESVS